MKKSVHYFAAAVILLLLAAVTAYLTSTPYGNAFFSNANGLVLSFLAFFAVDAGWWSTRTAEHRAGPSKGQDTGWTAAFLLCMLYFLWRHWNLYSFWQGWLTAAICVISLIGLLVRISGRWDADRVQWMTWSVCCAAVTCSILGCLLFWHPMTVDQVRQLVVTETGDDSFTFRYVEGGATMIDHHGAEAPLGYYIFGRKQADGSFGSYGTGRAVVYLGEAQDAYQSPRSNG